MGIRIVFDRNQVSPREAQIIDAIIATHMVLRGGLLRASGLSSSDPQFQTLAAELSTQFLKGAFPDLNFRYEHG